MVALTNAIRDGIGKSSKRPIASTGYGAWAYADIEELAHVWPGDHVAGRLLRFDWLLVCAVPPELLSRNWIVPAPVGASTAIQYFVPAVMLVAEIVTEFHAPLTGALIVTCASKVPGFVPALV